MKKMYSLLFALLLLAVTMAGCADDRHVYSPENRSVSVNANMLKYFPSGMDTNVAMADLIAVVKVKNDGEEFSYIMGEDIPERFQFPATDTRYTFKIEDVWYGEVKKKSIPVVLAGGKDSGCTKPHKNDLLIVFLSKREVDNVYILVDREASMFAINPPDDTLYSFSYLSEFTSLDGESPEKLKTEIDAAMEAVSNEMDKWEAFAGEALSDYLEKMALDKQEQDR